MEFAIKQRKKNFGPQLFVHIAKYFTAEGFDYHFRLELIVCSRHFFPILDSLSFFLSFFLDKSQQTLSFRLE